MRGLLSRLLEKRGIKEHELKTEPTVPGLPSERQEFDNWQRILSEGEMTVDKLKEFCQLQLRNIQLQLRNVDNSYDKQDRLVTMQNIYSVIIDAIKAPNVEKENLEKYLVKLLTGS